MSATTVTNNNNNNNTLNSVSEIDDINMFQAARRNGRRNALGDLGEQILQANTSRTSAEVDQLTPNFQSMSIKH